MRVEGRRKSKGARGAIWVSSRNQTLRQRETATQGEHEFAHHFWLRAFCPCRPSCPPETFYTKVVFSPLLNEARRGTIFCHSATRELQGPV